MKELAADIIKNLKVPRFPREIIALIGGAGILVEISSLAHKSSSTFNFNTLIDGQIGSSIVLFIIVYLTGKALLFIWSFIFSVFEWFLVFALGEYSGRHQQSYWQIIKGYLAYRGLYNKPIDFSIADAEISAVEFYQSLEAHPLIESAQESHTQSSFFCMFFLTYSLIAASAVHTDSFYKILVLFSIIFAVMTFNHRRRAALIGISLNRHIAKEKRDRQ